MDALKRYFPLPWMALLTLAFLHSLYAIFHPALAPLAWVGSAIATLTPVVFMLGIMVSGKGRVSPQFSWHWLPVAIGLLLIGTAHVLSPASVWPLAYGLILAAGGMLAYDHWYSRLGRGQAAVAEGDQFPTLPFLDANGEPVFSDDWQGQKTLVLFYRGNWCPLCVAQVKELAERYQAITDRGYRVVCISPQSQQQTAAIAERFSVPMQFLSDPQARITVVLESGDPAKDFPAEAEVQIDIGGGGLMDTLHAIEGTAIDTLRAIPGLSVSGTVQGAQNWTGRSGR